LVEIAVDYGVIGEPVLLARRDDDRVGNLFSGAGAVVGLRRCQPVLEDHAIHRGLHLARRDHGLRVQPLVSQPFSGNTVCLKG